MGECCSFSFMQYVARMRMYTIVLFFSSNTNVHMMTSSIQTTISICLGTLIHGFFIFVTNINQNTVGLNIVWGGLGGGGGGLSVTLELLDS